MDGSIAPDCKAIAKWLTGLMAKDRSPSLQHVTDEVREVNDKAAATVIKVSGRYYTVAVARMSEDFNPE